VFVSEKLQGLVHGILTEGKGLVWLTSSLRKLV
jgi:hypothetical protein